MGKFVPVFDENGTAQAKLDALTALSYTGNALKGVRVNAGETAYELATISGGAAANPSYSPDSFTVETETAKILSRHLKLTGSQRATLAGTATLRIG